MTAPMVCVPVETLKRLADGIENSLNNAKLREDAYDVGYMGAMLKDAEQLLAAAPAPPQAVQGENPCRCVDCGGTEPGHSSDCTYMRDLHAPAMPIAASGGVGTNAKTGGGLWHRDSDGLYWTGHHYYRTREQLIAECESTLAALRSQGQAVAVDDVPQRDYTPQIELWFFRELISHQRLSLLKLCGWPVEEIGESHSGQKLALRAILTAALAGQANKDAP